MLSGIPKIVTAIMLFNKCAWPDLTKSGFHTHPVSSFEGPQLHDHVGKFHHACSNFDQ